MRMSVLNLWCGLVLPGAGDLEIIVQYNINRRSFLFRVQKSIAVNGSAEIGKCATQSSLAYAANIRTSA